MWTRPGGIADQLVQTCGVADRDVAVKRFLEDGYLPLGIGQAEDVADAVVILASPLAERYRWRGARYRRYPAWVNLKDSHGH